MAKLSQFNKLNNHPKDYTPVHTVQGILDPSKIGPVKACNSCGEGGCNCGGGCNGECNSSCSAE